MLRGCTWKTGVHRTVARYSSTWVDRGAPPLTMKRTRPPKADLKALKRYLSSSGVACSTNLKGKPHDQGCIDPPDQLARVHFLCQASRKMKRHVQCPLLRCKPSQPLHSPSGAPRQAEASGKSRTTLLCQATPALTGACFQPVDRQVRRSQLPEAIMADMHVDVDMGKHSTQTGHGHADL